MKAEEEKSVDMQDYSDELKDLEAKEREILSLIHIQASAMEDHTDWKFHLDHTNQQFSNFQKQEKRKLHQRRKQNKK